MTGIAEVESRRPHEARPRPSAAGMSTSIAFLVRRLDYGGAERQLVLLARALHERGHRVTVIVFYPDGPLETDLRSAGVPIRSLDKRGRWDIAHFLRRLGQILSEVRPDIVHGYLTEPNMAALVRRGLGRYPRVIWGVRDSQMDATQYGLVSRLSGMASRGLALFADLIIANSQAGFDHAVSQGYPRHKMVVIPNGIDVARFRPDRALGRPVRQEWGVDESVRLVGLVGRLDPMKDHPTFLRAAALVAARRGDVRFVCVGNGPAPYRQQLEALANELGLSTRLTWSHARADMPAVYNALDVVCSSSAYGEGFPNVIGEAMACGVPCVATAVGDSARVIGRPHLIAPPRTPNVLADRLDTALDLLEHDLSIGARCRARIAAEFSVERLVASTEQALYGVMGAAR